ncbi:penicillin-binding protein activator [Shigella flexneri]
MVGPLLKNNVEELLKSRHSAERTGTEPAESVRKSRQYLLLRAFTEDEARDAARHIRDQGKQAPLVLIPRSSLGNRVANAFAQEWQKTGQRRVVTKIWFHQRITRGC